MPPQICPLALWLECPRNILHCPQGHGTRSLFLPLWHHYRLRSPDWQGETGMPLPWPDWTRKAYTFWVAAAKSLQSCPTLCDPIDGSPPGSPVPGILQARTLEWVAISFSNAWQWKNKVKLFSRVRLLATPWTAAHQAPPSMGFSRQEYWSGVPSPSPSEWLRGHNSAVQGFLCPKGWNVNAAMVPWINSSLILLFNLSHGWFRDMKIHPVSRESPYIQPLQAVHLLHSCGQIGRCSCHIFLLPLSLLSTSLKLHYWIKHQHKALASESVFYGIWAQEHPKLLNITFCLYLFMLFLCLCSPATPPLTLRKIIAILQGML